MASESKIVVVSGLPRSGTSMLMQMLTAGGVEAVTDGERTADEDNPKGYFEFEPVKQLAKDQAWIAQARGKAIKVVSHLAPSLPAGEQYYVIFLQRDLDEVLDSQEKMLARLGAKGADRSVLAKAFTNHLSAFESVASSRLDWRLLRLDYADVVRDPLTASQAIAEFLSNALDLTLDPQALASAVDPALYRNRQQRPS